MQWHKSAGFGNGEEAIVERGDGVDCHISPDLTIWRARFNGPASGKEGDGVHREVGHGGGGWCGGLIWTSEFRA